MDTDTGYGALSPSRAQAYAQVIAPTLLGVARRAVELAGLEEGDAALDVPTGTGLAAFLAAEKVGPEGTVVGVDGSPALLEEARRRAEAAGNSRIRWQEGDPARLSYADESFDAVFSLQAIAEHLRPDAVLEELRRVLVEGGRLVLTTWGSRAGNEWMDLVEQAVRPLLPPGSGAVRPFRLLQPSNLEALLQATGFEEIEVGRLTDVLRFQEAGGLMQWAAASREWGARIEALPPPARERVGEALAGALAARHKGGEAAVGREIVYVRAVAPPAP